MGAPTVPFYPMTHDDAVRMNAHLGKIASSSGSANITVLDKTFQAMIDGENTTELFKGWWDMAREQDGEENRYHTLERWFTILAQAWKEKKYTLRGPWWEDNTTGNTVLTPLDDLSGKPEATKATEETANEYNWADEDPMTWYVRGNALSLANGKVNILAVEGVDNTFDITGNTAPVYTFRLGLWKKWYHEGNYMYKSFKTVEDDGYYPWAADVDPADNSHRVMNWQATFGGSLTSGGNLTSGSGYDGNTWARNSNTTAINKSAAQGLTAARLWNNYEGVYSDTDLEPIIDLFQIRHRNLENSGIIEGCLSYNLDYTVAAAEEGATSVLLTTAQGANVLVGSFMDIGTAARGGQIARGNVLSKEEVTIDEVTYCRVHLDIDAVDVTEGAHFASLPWTPGSTERLPGHKDGSLYSLTDGKTPARIAGVEIIDGGYAVGLDPLWSSDWNAERTPKSIYTIYAVRDSEYQASSAGEHHESAGTFSGPNSGWQYFKNLEIRHDGMIVPEGFSGSGTTFYKSAFYFDDSSGVRAPWRFCYLNSGASGGLAGALGDDTPSYAYWHGRPRLSGSGKKRGEWAA